MRRTRCGSASGSRGRCGSTTRRPRVRDRGRHSNVTLRSPARRSPRAASLAMNVAVLDLGSTTFHLEVFQVSGEADVTPQLDRKQTLCLGDSVFRTGSIDRWALGEALDAVDDLAKAARETRP